MSNSYITELTLQQSGDMQDYRSLFGETAGYRKRSGLTLACFPPDKVVGYSRWHTNEYGTIAWNIYIIRTCRAGEEAVSIPGISPGAEMLLHTEGKHYCSKLLTLLRTLKRKGLYLPHIPASYYRYVHGRINVGLLVREWEGNIQMVEYYV